MSATAAGWGREGASVGWVEVERLLKREERDRATDEGGAGWEALAVEIYFVSTGAKGLGRAAGTDSLHNGLGTGVAERGSEEQNGDLCGWGRSVVARRGWQGYF